eukprot:Rhum_TRINITY_DN12167_c0_g1::Rhum_TRINITY_DN12167_c0_g1_i1::g.49743::m.49743
MGTLEHAKEARFEPWRALAKKTARRAVSSFKRFKADGLAQQETKQIMLDVPRTPYKYWGVPDEDVPLYKESLADLLHAWVGYVSVHMDNTFPYVQGMTFIALIPLAVMRGDAEDAFWLFFAVMTKALSPGTFSAEPPLAGHRADAALLFEVCAEQVPSLAKAVGREEFKHVCAHLSTKWMLCVFANALPREVVLNLWDSLLTLEGTRAADVIALPSTPLFVWAVAVLKAVRPAVEREVKTIDPEMPRDIVVAQIIQDAAKALHPGFAVEWTEVPGFDAVKLKKRHAAVGVYKRKQTKMRHVWGPAPGAADAKDSDEEDGTALNFLLDEQAARSPPPQHKTSAAAAAAAAAPAGGGSGGGCVPGSIVAFAAALDLVEAGQSEQETQGDASARQQQQPAEAAAAAPPAPHFLSLFDQAEVPATPTDDEAQGAASESASGFDLDYLLGRSSDETGGACAKKPAATAVEDAPAAGATSGSGGGAAAAADVLAWFDMPLATPAPASAPPAPAAFAAAVPPLPQTTASPTPPQPPPQASSQSADDVFQSLWK